MNIAQHVGEAVTNVLQTLPQDFARLSDPDSPDPVFVSSLPFSRSHLAVEKMEKR
jgi:hypothetical protein